MTAKDGHERVKDAVDAVYRAESRRILATLIRLLGDFERAEEALYEAFRAALETWPVKGIPENPRAWLISTGRFKGIDAIRRHARHESIVAQLAGEGDSGGVEPGIADDEHLEDDRLRLIFTCCHPALAPEARVALTLRELCGLTTEEIARAFLVTPPALAQRIVRAKAKIRKDRIPYEVPPPAELPARLGAVLQVVYLLFNEGYSASFGDFPIRADLSAEAIRLGRLLASLLPAPEVLGLLALMLLQDSRRAARSTEEGDLILLEDQDRSRWDQAQIAEGLALVARALALRTDGRDPYTLQAAIASVHAASPSAAKTDWARIVEYYDELAAIQPTPVVSLNRAVAVAMRDGPANGLALIDEILAGGNLREYHLAHSARADLCRRLGRTAEARAAYKQALSLTDQASERRFLERRLADLA